MTVERRAVRIASMIMQAAGLCKYEDPVLCRKMCPATIDDCVRCIERWLLAKARKEIEKEGKKDGVDQL